MVKLVFETNAFFKEYEFILLIKLRSHYLDWLLVSVQYFTMKKLIKSKMESDSWNIKKYTFFENDILLLEYSIIKISPLPNWTL